MATMDSYIPGTPCWVDLGTPDIDATAAFYAGLLGWDVPEGTDEFGGYRSCTLGGRTVAGIMPMEGPVSAWTMYVATSDADATAKAFTAAGGSLMGEVMQVGELGRMAIGTDNAGIFLGFWEPALHIGAQAVNEHGAWTWSELMTRDLPKAKAFYPEVFGWTVDDESMEGYTLWRVEGREVGGGMPAPDEIFPPGFAGAWGTYFEVSDCDAAVAKAVELGATVANPPMDMEGVGRMAAIAGPTGEMFSLITSAQS